MGPHTQKRPVPRLENSDVQSDRTTLLDAAKDFSPANGPLGPVMAGQVAGLRRGRKNDTAAVIELQTLLKKANYLAARADGVFGPKTEAAVREFQRRVSLEDDGIAGKATCRSLYDYVNANKPQADAPPALEKATKSAFCTPAKPDINKPETALRPVYPQPAVAPKIPLSLSIQPKEDPSPAAARQNVKEQPLDAVRNGKKVIGPGETGEAVAAVQKLLNRLGANPPLKENGEYNVRTYQAIVEFEQYIIAKEGRRDRPDGKVTALTLSKMDFELRRRGLDSQGIFETLESWLPRNRTMLGPATSRSFERAMKFVFDAEGGRNSDPQDGGNKNGTVTYKGVTQASLDEYLRKRNLPPKQTVELTDTEIRQFYHDSYWKISQCQRMPECLSIAVLDSAINMGNGGAIAALQRVLGVKPTGKLDERTLVIINETEPEWLMREYLRERRRFHEELAKKPKFEKYGKGWANRDVRLEAEIRGEMPPLVSISDPIREDLGSIDGTRSVIASLQRSMRQAVTGELTAEQYVAIMANSPRVVRRSYKD